MLHLIITLLVAHVFTISPVLFFILPVRKNLPCLTQFGISSSNKDWTGPVTTSALYFSSANSKLDNQFSSAISSSSMKANKSYLLLINSTILLRANGIPLLC